MESSEGVGMIPVYVNTFNRLTTTRKLCEQISAIDNAVPVIIDNASTWEPLLDWYTKDCPFEVIRLTENYGHHSPWRVGATARPNNGFYCVTDCDLDLEGVPSDLMDVLKLPLEWQRMPVVKSGVALRINDLPSYQSQVREWESRFWRQRIVGDYYAAPIDTTLAMYRANTPVRIATKVAGVRAVRAAGPYTARHVPWYLDPTNLDEENQNYFATANDSNSWRPDGDKLTSRFCTTGRRHAPRRV